MWKYLLPAMLACYAPGAMALECAGFGAGGELPGLDNPRLQPRTTLLCNDGYASLNSGLAHEPLWSAEHLTRQGLEDAEGLGRVTKTFHEDLRLPIADRGELSDYRGSGYDRGHMTPSGDAVDATAQEETFSLANVVPQTAALNEGIWTGVEMAVRRLARENGDVFVVTGPAFSGPTRAIGDDNVLVPTSTWKAVFVPATNGAAAYVCKNTDEPTCVTVSVAELTRATGVDPFPALSDAVKETAMPLPQPEASPYRPRQAARHYAERDGGSAGSEYIDRRVLAQTARAGWQVLNKMAQKWEQN
ncbi:DNA/RNA non-specific endonuclease [Gluconacetobacter diazotrophicus]|uniref:Endonuclease n=1 Tax=Gluconacetobacter diazotrophicus TaxID=33996 RepID=A0A7W4NGK3_GLUDI|nr:DNA/RNA non-specific endonuclease [Gluconacetobacter diazotrophicus]MBB2157361.1 DNA/RNA non-specific endonuclease [Gluconacetobacter diazotrophicus]